MSPPGSRYSAHLRRYWPAYLVLALALLPAVALYLRVQDSTRRTRRGEFDVAVSEVRSKADFRLTFELVLLRGIRGLLAASGDVTPAEFRRYLDSLGLRNPGDGANAGLPGLRDLGYAMRVTPEDRESHIARMRRNGFASYTPLLLGPGPDHFPIAYLDDFRAEGMVPSGWDAYGDPIRREAMDKARDTGEAVSTAPTEIFALDPSRRVPGFVIYLPVYAEDVIPGTVSERRRQLAGFVFASFDSGELWRSIEQRVDPVVDLRVHDGTRLVPETRVYPSRATLLPDRRAEFFDAYSADGMGRTWSFSFTSTPYFEQRLETYLPTAALAAGCLVALGLFSIACMLVRGRSRAEAMASDLRASEGRFRGIFESIQDLYYRTDATGALVMVSPSCLAILGYEPGELLGRPATKALASPEQAEATAARLEKEGKLEDHEVVLCRKDGRRIDASINAHLILDAQGIPTGSAGLIRDITPRKQLEAERIRTSKLESVGLLAGGIAHDFNNILTSILGNVSLLRLSRLPSAEEREQLAEVERAAHRARDLTRQLLTFARGGAPIRKAASLPDILRECASFANHGTRVRCTFDLQDPLWPVEVDVGQLSQVLHNLILNAVQAMPDGGLVTLRAVNQAPNADPASPPPRGPRVRVSITDTGVGIPPEDLSRVFDPYFTTKTTGTGLGLATVHSIIQRHEGRITVESQPGRGTTFHLWLPAAPNARIEPPPAQGTPPTGSGRILVVDDEAPIRDLLHRALTRLGYEPTAVADSTGAAAAVGKALEEGHPFQLAILDLTIPGSPGGHEILARLRRLQPDLRAVVSSGYSNDPVMANHRAHGFQGILEKPYQTPVLAQLLRELIAPAAPPTPPAQPAPP